MCITGGSNFSSRQPKQPKVKKVKTKIKESKLSKDMLKHGDPNFVDERKIEPNKKSWFQIFLNFFK